MKKPKKKKNPRDQRRGETWHDWMIRVSDMDHVLMMHGPRGNDKNDNN